MIDNTLRAPPSDPSGVTGKVCDWVYSVELKDIPEEIKTHTKYLILDGIACAAVGAQLPWSKTATNALFKMEGPGDCTVIGWDRRISPLNAALINSTFIQGFELDDVHADAPWHANSIILPSLFAAAEHSRKGEDQHRAFDGKSFLLSTIVGFEIGSRVGHALHGSEMLSRGWHSGAVFGPPAAAVAVSKLLDLSPEQTEDAIGTACTQSCGLMSAQYESMSKRMQHGFAARNGLFSALMSKESYTGIDKVFERPYGGFLSTFGQGSSHSPNYLSEKLVSGLGESWRGLDGIKVKPYASMIATHSPIDCIAALQARYPNEFADPSSIRKVIVEQSKAPHAHGGQEVKRPLNAVGAQMSTRYTTAVQLLDRVVLMDQFNSTNIGRESLWDIVDKVDCIWNPDFDDKSAWYTRVTVTFENGPAVVKEASQPSTYGSPLSNERIRKKWSMLADSVMDADKRDAIEALVLNLENVEDIDEILQLLAGRVRNPIEAK
ncbi:hypothetical protein MMC17_000619 [Xylographa soralifera]|nr:hypothetical protein [Xylographa soralifera]